MKECKHRKSKLKIGSGGRVFGENYVQYHFIEEKNREKIREEWDIKFVKLVLRESKYKTNRRGSTSQNKYIYGFIQWEIQ